MIRAVFTEKPWDPERVIKSRIKDLPNGRSLFYRNER